MGQEFSLPARNAETSTTRPVAGRGFEVCPPARALPIPSISSPPWHSTRDTSTGLPATTNSGACAGDRALTSSLVCYSARKVDDAQDDPDDDPFDELRSRRASSGRSLLQHRTPAPAIALCCNVISNHPCETM